MEEKCAKQSLTALAHLLYTLTSRRKSGRLFFDLSMMEKKAIRTRDHRARTRFFSWRSKCAKGMCEADSDCTRASFFQRRLAFFSHQVHQEIGGCTANDGGFELLVTLALY